MREIETRNINIKENNIMLKNLTIGQAVEGKGIYVGEWSPRDSKGRSLGKTYDLCAAPKDRNPQINEGSGQDVQNNWHWEFENSSEGFPSLVSK